MCFSRERPDGPPPLNSARSSLPLTVRRLEIWATSPSRFREMPWWPDRRPTAPYMYSRLRAPFGPWCPSLSDQLPPSMGEATDRGGKGSDVGPLPLSLLREAGRFRGGQLGYHPEEGATMK